MKQTVLITGASGGIGGEFANLFAKDNFNLVLVARHKKTLSAVAQELRNTYKTEVTVIVKDLTLPHSPKEIHDELHKKNITIDVLINNAGFGDRGFFKDTNIQEQLDMIQINVSALTYLTRLFLVDMLQLKRGKILNVASTAAFQPGPTMAVYFATKAFVLSFSEALSNEMKGTGVTVTALCPGPTKTGFEKRAKTNFGSRVMRADEVARIGYKALMNGRSVVVAGFMNNLKTVGVRLLPRDIVTSIVRGNMR